MSLSDRDKTPKLSGWGHDFHHTNPQRRVPCVLGDMLAPLSAEISKVPATAMEDEFEMSPLPARASVWVLTVVVPV